MQSREDFYMIKQMRQQDAYRHPRYRWSRLKCLSGFLVAVTSIPPDPVTSPRIMDDWGQ